MGGRGGEGVKALTYLEHFVQGGIYRILSEIEILTLLVSEARVAMSIRSHGMSEWEWMFRRKALRLVRLLLIRLY